MVNGNDTIKVWWVCDVDNQPVGWFHCRNAARRHAAALDRRVLTPGAHTVRRGALTAPAWHDASGWDAVRAAS